MALAEILIYVSRTADGKPRSTMIKLLEGAFQNCEWRNSCCITITQSITPSAGFGGHVRMIIYWECAVDPYIYSIQPFTVHSGRTVVLCSIGILC